MAVDKSIDIGSSNLQQLEKLTHASLDHVEALLPERALRQVVTRRRLYRRFGLHAAGRHQQPAVLLRKSPPGPFRQRTQTGRKQITEGVREVVERQTADIEVELRDPKIGIPALPGERVEIGLFLCGQHQLREPCR